MQLGNYELIEEIGRGAFAIVWRGRHMRLKTDVAVKVLSPEAASDPNTRTRFVQEARTASQLRHTNIVQIDDLGEQDGQAYLVMTYLAGGDLGQWRLANPAAPWRIVIARLKDVAAALDHAHASNVWHRDVKPSNILLDKVGRAYLGDFGLARVAESPELTRVGSVVGTANYISPEQAEGRPLDGRADQYSLAVVAYELLTGYLPFDAETSTAMLVLHVTKTPQAPSSYEHVPSEVDDVLLRALSKEADERFSSCDEFVRSLEAAWAASELHRYRRLLADAKQKIAAGDFGDSHTLLQEAQMLLPNHPELAEALAEYEQARQNAERYEQIVKHWNLAQQHGEMVLSLLPEYPDRDGVLAKLGLREPQIPLMDQLREWGRQIAMGVLLALPLVALCFYAAFLFVTRQP